MIVRIKIFEHETEILSRELGEGTFVLGRSEKSDLVLSNEHVSRSHAELRITGASAYVANLSTSAKIFVSGRPTETAELKHGDEIVIGPFRILVFMGTEISASAYSKSVPQSGLGGEVAEPDSMAGGADVLANENEAQADSQVDAADPASSSDLGFDSPDPFSTPGESSQASSADSSAQSEHDSALPGENANENDQSGGFSIPDAQPQPMSAPMSSSAVAQADGNAALNIGGETQVQAKPLVAKLMFTEGPRAGEELFLETYEVTFGRSKRADVYIDDEKLSRVHAKISRVGMGYRLVDLGSRNGTYVNGMRVLEHPLNSYDIISFGKNKVKFLVHDLLIQEQQAEGTAGPLVSSGGDQTESVQLTPSRQAQIIQLQQAGPDAGGPPLTPGLSEPNQWKSPEKAQKKKSKLVPMLLVSLLALGLVYIFAPEEKNADKAAVATKSDTPTPEASTESLALTPAMPQEYFELNPEQQRALEGHYQTALRSAEADRFADAVFQLSKVHELVPFYKNSRDLAESFQRRLKEKQIAQAEAKAKTTDKQDLSLYLEDGLEYLKVGDFDRAADAFNSAIVIDPNSELAQKGLRAAELKIKDIAKVPEERDPELEKRKKVIELFQRAVAAFANKSYSEAIDVAKDIRKIELQGDTQYLSEAKQIIDRARMLQKEEFEPFLIQAKEKYAEADYNASRDLCEEMLKRDPTYGEASECMLKAKRQLNRLAKEAYTHGYILESMNKIEEAKQYWRRAKNYVRKGDSYYDKIMKKLDYYQ